MFILLGVTQENIFFLRKQKAAVRNQAVREWG